AGLLYNRHIPAAYLRTATAQRLALLQGLMDTRGFPGKGSYVTFGSPDRPLVDAVFELIVSLGIRAHGHERPAKWEGVVCGTSYRVSFTPTMPVFRLARKAARIRFDGTRQLVRHHRMILAVDAIEPRAMRCIAVDSPHRMYLCGRSMVPTQDTGTGA